MMVDFLKNSYIAFLTKEWFTKNLQDMQMICKQEKHKYESI